MQYTERNRADKTLCNVVTKNMVDTLNTPLVTTIHSNKKIETGSSVLHKKEPRYLQGATFRLHTLVEISFIF